MREFKLVTHDTKVSLYLRPNGELYGRGTCYDKTWNHILNQKEPVLLLREVTGVHNDANRGFIITQKVQTDLLSPYMMFDGTGPSGYQSFDWLCKPPALTSWISLFS